MQVSMSINGQTHTAEIPSRLLLVHFIRDRVGLTGTNVGCDTSSCGACTVLLNGHAVKSCTIFAAQVQGEEITTIEGLAQGETLDPVQQAFHEHHALQCGFCTPGMVLACVSLLRDNPAPAEDEVRSALKGNICRCTGYHNIVSAALAAARQPSAAPVTSPA